MGAKNCPETPRQKMINMMYIVLTAMLALNVAAEVLEAFKVVDSSLMQTMKAVDMQNAQVYSSFEQAFIENPTKTEEWKNKADIIRDDTKSLISYISQLKEELVKSSGSEPVNEENPYSSDGFYLYTENGDTLQLKNEQDLNVPSEMMITQKKGEELKIEIENFRETLVGMLSEDDVELRETILQELETSDPPVDLAEGGESKSWESEHFEDKPIVAVLTLLSKIQIDVKNSEANLIKYLYAQIDAGSFKFNKLAAQVIPTSSVVLQGDEYVAEVFLAAEDTTQQPEIFINGRQMPVIDGKATYTASANQVGEFSWGGLIKYKTPAGIIQNYRFEQDYQVTAPSVTMSATKMNVFYRGLENPFDVGGGGIPKENLEVSMTNGKVTKKGEAYVIEPTDLDEQGRRTKVSVYANIGGTRRLVGTSDWRVKPVPDPVAQIAGRSSGDIRKEELVIQQGVLAVLEDFDFDFEYTVTEFTVETTGAGGYTNRYPATSNRFTQEQLNEFKRLNPQSWVHITNIKAVGENGESRDLNSISFKII
ncbi:type IX secretion system motor protein PorM/GldM [Maribellus maritimus]|uniref:type IX secretion system motor protein PorM/GldM n=1 Tax=Maribellus maritimus TaxID=2870838 RepID=UPI0021D43B01|nr:gliding motility protein GldM [Maribellus maritimus]